MQAISGWQIRHILAAHQHHIVIHDLERVRVFREEVCELLDMLTYEIPKRERIPISSAVYYLHRSISIYLYLYIYIICMYYILSYIYYSSSYIHYIAFPLSSQLSSLAASRA